MPARGKALVATDLSISIPEGTYARVGKFPIFTSIPRELYRFVDSSLSLVLIMGFFFFFFAAPRSGLAWKHSIDVGAGVIDADYRGPVGVILFNHSDVDFEVKVGDRIAQLIIEKILTPDVVEVEDLDSTVRGEGGFGSTGV